jgi:drug/metabolite transporter (DMT)-like permease
MVYLFAVGAAFFYGLAAVMQHREAAAAPHGHNLRIGLLVHLVRRPLWAAGIAADVAGFALQAAALGRGPLTLVQPLLTGGLFFALILSAVWDWRGLSRKEWAGAIALMVGLGLLLAVGAPTAGRAIVPFRRWIVAGGFVGAGVLVLLVASRGAGPRVRPALLAVAAAMTFAASDALTKSAVDLFQAHGLWEVLDGWYLYALIGVALLGTLLVQSAFQSGPLASSLPALTAVEPVASSIVGVILFAETFSTHPIDLAIEVFSIGLALVAVWILGTSPVVTGAYARGAQSVRAGPPGAAPPSRPAEGGG